MVDDSAALRASLSQLLDRDVGIRVIGTAEDGRDAVDKARHLAPDLVLMDLRMPRMNGLDATREILRLLPAVRVIVVTTHEGESVRAACQRAGADGFVSKGAGARQIMDEIHRVTSRCSDQ